ncbi:MAG: acyl-CoA dehydrogenase family protein [Deltaproteobacteria bacterium]|nr:MAG: acyl-CoA dehydrogenase family protein [Deltaproteobacteria bacterium]
MEIELNTAQKAARDEFKIFVDEHVAPFADEFDSKERIPDILIRTICERGYMGAMVPKEYGGKAVDALTWGLLCEEIGRGSASLVSLLTVHSMVSQTLAKWGNEEQRKKWLPKLATGESIGAFGLTEPEVGSDGKSVLTEAIADGNDHIVNGEKRWISFGQIADLFLILAQLQGKPTAFLIERNTEGFSAEPISGMLGFRSAMLAELNMNDCRIPSGNMVGNIGFGFSHVAGTALDHGRYCISWASLGLLQGCVNACLEYAGQRRQFGAFIKDHQLVQEMITEMAVHAKAARLMCYHAAYQKDRGDPSLIMETSMAKYFNSRVAVKAALNAVQIHGANGCSDRYPVARYLRDAKILEIIEGSNQMQQIIISQYTHQEHIKAKRQALIKELETGS